MYIHIYIYIYIYMLYHSTLGSRVTKKKEKQLLEGLLPRAIQGDLAPETPPPRRTLP